MIKSIFEGEPSQLEGQQKEQVVPLKEGIDNVNELPTLAKSFFEAEGLNTNSFDIRYYEKEKVKNSQIPK